MQGRPSTTKVVNQQTYTPIAGDTDYSYRIFSLCTAKDLRKRRWESWDPYEMVTKTSQKLFILETG